jgi:PPP family 3-phenylpropionic acid transporter
MGNIATRFNNDLTRIRIYYFLWIGGGGLLYPFISLFYREQGLTGTQIGMLTSIGWGVGLIAAPIWGRRSDRVNNPRRLLQVSLIGTALCILWLGQQDTFLWIAFIIALEAIAGSASEPISITQALAITGNEKTGFGSVRVFGSLGWALVAPLAGWMIEKTGLGIIFPGYALTQLLGALVLAIIITNPTRKSRGEPRISIRKVIKGLSLDRSMIGLAIALVIYWFSSSGAAQFESIYLSQLGASEGLIGLASTIGALVELPGMVLADRLVNSYGAGKILGWSMLLKTCGLALVVLAPSLTAIFIMRILGGFYFSMYVVSSYSYAADGAPEGQSNTILALYYVTLRGMVMLFAGPFGGTVFDAFGAYWLYAIAMTGNVFSWLILRLTERKSLAVTAY